MYWFGLYNDNNRVSDINNFISIIIDINNFISIIIIVSIFYHLYGISP